MRPISGRFRAASMKRAVCRPGSPALRRCDPAARCVKPGSGPESRNRRGPECYDAAFGIAWANARLSAFTTPAACDSALWRSSHGLSWTKKKPMFDEYAPVTRE